MVIWKQRHLCAAFYSDIYGYKFKRERFSFLFLSLSLQEYIKRLKREPHKNSYKTRAICVLLHCLSGNITGISNKSSTSLKWIINSCTVAETSLNTILVFRVYQKQISFLLKASAVFLNISAIIRPRSFVSYCHSTGSFISNLRKFHYGRPHVVERIDHFSLGKRKRSGS